ncbi:hypothetical protein XENTR_v10004169 [Xenopus tropicalis]|nr:hypothetical protein XENTR_v10004169 [Xenopus tropicalis]KAE8576411.1 hypothetical protein XENTR_v10004169 [Xenopus tropicalis]
MLRTTSLIPAHAQDTSLYKPASKGNAVFYIRVGREEVERAKDRGTGCACHLLFCNQVNVPYSVMEHLCACGRVCQSLCG